MAGAFARDFRTRLQKRKSLDSPAGMYVKQGEPTCALREERAAAILQLMRQSEQRGQYAIAEKSPNVASRGGSVPLVGGLSTETPSVRASESG
eukprot:2594086-Pleurochrysis_carterae.AAC.2